MIPCAEVERLISAKRDAAANGIDAGPGVGEQILRDGYDRCMRLDDEGLPWAYGLALLYELALTSLASEFSKVSGEPVMAKASNFAPMTALRAAASGWECDGRYVSPR